MQLGGNEDAGSYSIGIAADVYQKYKFDLKYVDFVSVSPDGKWVAFTELFNAYVAPMPETGRTIALDRKTKAVPVRAVSADVGSYLHWSADSQSARAFMPRSTT